MDASNTVTGAFKALQAHQGEMARRIASHDWSTSLGPVEDWPSSLMTTVGLMIFSPVPMVLLWGEDGVMIYNDAYSVFAGRRHPTILGSRVREGWPEVADFNDNVMKIGLAGGTLAYRDQELTLNRTGAPEQVWMNLDYSPVYDESGKPGGVIAIVVETTDRVLSERRLAAASERQRRYFEQAPGFVIVMTGADHRVEFVNEAHRRVFGSDDWIGETIRDAFPSIDGQGFFETLDQVYTTGETFRADNAQVRYRRSPEGPEETRYLSFIYAPIFDDQGAITGIFCDGFDVTERHRAEADRRESEDQLRLALDAAAMGTFIWYPDEDRTEGDERMMALFGLPTDGLLSLQSALADRIHPEDGPGYAEAVGRALDPAGNGVLRKDIRVRLPGDVQRTLSIMGQVQFAGRPRTAVRMAGVARDVTDSKHAEEALRQSEARLRFLDALGKEAMRGGDADSILAVTNRMVGEHLGVSICAYADVDDDQNGFNVRRDWSAPGAPSVVGRYRIADFGKRAVKTLAAGDPLIIGDAHQELPAKEAAAFQALGVRATICMPLIKAGRLIALMAIHDQAPRAWSMRELSLLREVAERSWAHVERAAAEAELRVSEADFRTLAKAMPNHVWTASPDGQLDWFNEQVYAYSGAEPGSLDGAGWGDIVHPDDLPAAAGQWGRSLQSGETYETQFRLRRADGVWRWHIARAVPIWGERGKIARWIGTNTDIQDQKEVAEALTDINATLERRVEERTSELAQAQDALRQAQKMEAIGQLTGGIAHDFNNLLTGISGSLEILGNRLAQGRIDTIPRYLDAAQGAAKRAASLTQRLLAFARRQTLDSRPTDVNQLIANMEELLGRSIGPNIAMEVVAAPGLWPALIDPSQLESALLNLGINAKDAMPNGGRLIVETANLSLHAKAARDRELPAGEYVAISVADTGTGMPPEVVARAFDPFFTTKPLGQGTGLGLSMIYGFVRQSGGYVRIDSEVDRGTTMRLYLPRFLGEADADESPSAAMPFDGGHGETVLVVDDEPTVRMLVADVLAEAGYGVLEADDGAEGLAILQSAARIDLLVTDVGLPGDMNGRQLADAGRVLRPGMKVLFITGYAESAVIGHDRLEPGMQIITKPFAVEALGNKIREMIDG